MVKEWINVVEERNKNVAGREMRMRLKKRIVVKKGRESVKERKTNEENYR